MASALFGMRAAPSRRNGGPRPSSALPLNRARRPRLRRWRRPLGAKACAPAAGFRCAPLCPCCAVSRGSQGRGACFSGLWPPRRCGGAPLRSGPAPRFWPRGGAILFSLRRVWGLRRLRAALKVYRTARAAQCKCSVHGFAMNPCVSLHVATAPYYREARVTLPRRQTACGMRHCWRSPALIGASVDGD